MLSDDEVRVLKWVRDNPRDIMCSFPTAVVEGLFGRGLLGVHLEATGHNALAEREAQDGKK